MAEHYVGGPTRSTGTRRTGTIHCIMSLSAYRLYTNLIMYYSIGDWADVKHNFSRF